jgi:hypothetical protein
MLRAIALLIVNVGRLGDRSNSQPFGRCCVASNYYLYRETLYKIPFQVLMQSAICISTLFRYLCRKLVRIRSQFRYLYRHFLYKSENVNNTCVLLDMFDT